MTTINDLIQRATDIINEHNTALTAGDVPVDASAFFTALRRDGGTTPEALAAYTAEDLRSLGVPRGVAKRLAAVFSPPAVATPAAPAAGMPGVLTKKLVATMSPRALVEHYDPADPLSMVLPRLREIAGDARFVVFTADEKAVDVDATTKLLQEVINEEAPRSVYDGRAVHLLGFSPAKALADECPLHPGEPLRSDGTCPTIERAIVGVPDARVLLHLAISRTREERSDTPKAAHDAADMLERPDALDAMRRRYPRALVEMQRMKAAGMLPALKVQRGQGAAPGLPFGGDVGGGGLPAPVPASGGNGDIHARLCALLPVQFEEIVFRLNVPRGILSGPSAPLSSRAIELIRWAEGAGKIGDLAASLGDPSASASGGPVNVLIMAAPGDRGAVEACAMHLATMARRGLVQVACSLDRPAGVNVTNYRAEQDQRAEVLICLLTASFLASTEPERAADLMRQGKRVVPVYVAPCVVSESPIGRLQVLPRDKAISQYARPDEAWVEVVGGIRHVVESVKAARPSR